MEGFGSCLVPTERERHMDRRQFLGAAPLFAAAPAVAKSRHDVLSFNAAGDGVKDDTASIQRTVDEVKLVGGGVVRIPEGTYKISAPIRVYGNFQFRSIKISGENAEIVSTHAGPAFEFDPSSPTPAPQVKQRSEMDGLSFSGPGRDIAGSSGISIINGATVRVRNCKVRGYEKGISGVGALILRFLEVELYGNAYGYHFTSTKTFGANDIHFTSCFIFENTKAGFAENFPNSVMTFNQCEIEGNNFDGNGDDGVVTMEFSNAGKVTLVGCHVEENHGRANIVFAGGNRSSSLNIIGSEILPGRRISTVVEMATNFGPFGHLHVIGSRITSGRGNQIDLGLGISACIIGETEGGISGDLSKLVVIKDGKVATGGIEP